VGGRFCFSSDISQPTKLAVLFSKIGEVVSIFIRCGRALNDLVRPEFAPFWYRAHAAIDEGC